MPNELQSSQLTALVEHHTGGTMKCRTTALLPSVFSPVRQNFYLYFWFIVSFLSVCLLLYFSVRRKWTSALLEWEELSLRRGAAVLAETFPLSADCSADPQPCHPTHWLEDKEERLKEQSACSALIHHQSVGSGSTHHNATYELQLAVGTPLCLAWELVYFINLISSCWSCRFLKHCESQLDIEQQAILACTIVACISSLPSHCVSCSKICLFPHPEGGVIPSIKGGEDAQCRENCVKHTEKCAQHVEGWGYGLILIRKALFFPIFYQWHASDWPLYFWSYEGKDRES